MPTCLRPLVGSLSLPELSWIQQRLLKTGAEKRQGVKTKKKDIRKMEIKGQILRLGR